MKFIILFELLHDFKMTVTYTAKVATSKLGTFIKLLARWKGSIYKLLFREFLVFVALFYSLVLIYHLLLNDDQKRLFEVISVYCDENSNLIPLAFVLGFYVTIVVSRWWDQYMILPWPDDIALIVTASISGHDERGRLMRRTIMRYLCLTFVMVFSAICPQVHLRFPTLQHMTDSGFLLPGEQIVLDNINTPYNKYIVPITWITALINRARKEGRIRDPASNQELIIVINKWRKSLMALFNYDWISVPLVYTQVVTIAVNMFFLASLMGSQPLDKGSETHYSVYFPIFTYLQFFFYMGWLKVAETLINPFGFDDDDFEINHLIDRNLQYSYLVVDEMHAEHPELIKDVYWETSMFDVPYTLATEKDQHEPFLGSAFNKRVNTKHTHGVYKPYSPDVSLASRKSRGGIIPPIFKKTYDG